MANTLPNIPLPANTWVDLYAASGITVGTQITLTNIGPVNVNLCTKATTPNISDGFEPVKPFESKTNPSGASGAWAFSTSATGVNVKAA